jgi:hypothetical protein
VTRPSRNAISLIMMRDPHQLDTPEKQRDQPNHDVALAWVIRIRSTTPRGATCSGGARRGALADRRHLVDPPEAKRARVQHGATHGDLAEAMGLDDGRRRALGSTPKAPRDPTRYRARPPRDHRSVDADDGAVNHSSTIGR